MPGKKAPMTKTLLIVEDDPLSSKLLCDILSADGHAVLQAGRARDALDLLCEHLPDLIITDLLLPDMSGLRLTRMIRADPMLRDIPVLATSAFSVPEDLEDVRAAGCDGFLAKPVSLAVVRREVARLLASSRLFGEMPVQRSDLTAGI
jgi:two-component system cell cycle response regulator DivK